MTYFKDKPYSTAESIAGKLTNAVKEGLFDIANQYNMKINEELPEFKTNCGEDEKFSGNGVDEILNTINEEYQQYNRNYRYQYHAIYKDRKTLFNLE